MPALDPMKPGSAGPGVPGIHPIIYDEMGNEIPPRRCAGTDPLIVRRKLCEYNWYVSTTARPCALRMVVMPHVTADVVRAFAADLKQVV